MSSICATCRRRLAPETSIESTGKAAADSSRRKASPSIPASLACVAAVMALCCTLPGELGAQTITKTVPAGLNPWAMAVNPVTNKIYVVNQGDSTVTVINEAAGTLTTLRVDTQPNSIAVNPVTNTVYVANFIAGSVTVIDGATDTVTATVDTGGADVVALNALTNMAYVTSGSVTVINGANNSTTNIAGTSNGQAIAVNPVTNRIYVGSPGTNLLVIDGATNSVIATLLPGDNDNNAIAVNPVTNMVYVADDNGGEVTVIDGATNAIVTTITVGGLVSNPTAIAVNPLTNMVYVSNNKTAAPVVNVINGATNTVTATLTVGNEPVALAVDPLTNSIYVSNCGPGGGLDYCEAGSAAGSIAVIDGATNTVRATVSDAGDPHAVAVNPVTHKIYVGNFGSNNVTVIDGATNAAAPLAAGTNPNAVAANPATNTVYVANGESNDVTVISASGSTTTLPAGTNPVAVAVNPVTDTVYVANQGSNNVTEIDGATNTVTGTVTAGTAPVAVTVNPLTGMVYVANGGSNNVTAINGATGSTSTIAVGTNPVAAAVNPVTNTVYVANAGSNNVTAINGAANSTTTIAAGADPVAIAVNPVTNLVYVANQGADTVTVIDGADNSTSTLAAGSAPNALTVNPATNTVYVSNGSSANMTVINGATNSTATVATGLDPVAIAANPATNTIYTANSVAGTVSVIDGATSTVEPAVTVGSNPNALAINFASNSVYVADNASSSVSLLIPNAIQTAPLTAVVQGVIDSQTVNGLAIFATTNPTPSFTAAVTSSYSPVSPPPTAVYYQLDTTQAAWQAATDASAAGANPATFGFQLGTVLPGVRVVYVYATYGDEGTPESTSRGTGNSPEIGNVTSYVFAELLPATAPTTTLTLLASSLNPSVQGQSVTFTATVSPLSGPAGTVTFYDNGNALGVASLAAGTATYTTSTLVAGTHPITAAYSGNSGYAGSASAVLNQVVDLGTLTVTANNLAMPYGGTVPTLTYTITGFVGSDTETSGTPVLTTTATSTSPAGIYPIFITQGSLQAPNYMLVFVNGKMTVELTGDGAGFGITATPSSQSVKGGTTATYTVTVAAENGFAGPVTLACSGQPQDGTCSFAQSVLTLGLNGNAETTMTVTTTTADAVLRIFGNSDLGFRISKPSPLGSNAAALLARLVVPFDCCGVVALLLGALKRKKTPGGMSGLAGLLCMAAVALIMIGLFGCGGSSGSGSGSGSKEQTYTIGITAISTATGATLTQSTSVTLVVN
ncbi:MAG: beta-propeller fold lactonase family protein [Terriglobales bacterium]|jgi:YVTN family beta-propeller protein